MSNTYEALWDSKQDVIQRIVSAKKDLHDENETGRVVGSCPWMQLQREE